MIYPFWKLTTFIVVGEVLAVSVNVWTLYDHWNDVWWQFIPKAINLALLCGAATGAFYALARCYHRDKEHRHDARHSG
jgi:hypothetical protein